ncbi:Hypothetical predicted protein [Marmota monax]|uniref:Uncharacterized protein n=1 Tax=Marmota monax TaxID=9995 RepID=A0A5E4B142_MARMO|nr:hypothetical protein GHT09_007938 [Marmota monax]VTJ62499.1 Hypothetical predicted protein [Marmota monax]
MDRAVSFSSKEESLQNCLLLAVPLRLFLDAQCLARENLNHLSTHSSASSSQP